MSSESSAPAPDGEAGCEKERYFSALRLWLQQAQASQQASACFPYYLLARQLPAAYQAPGSPAFLNNNYQPGAQWPYHQLFPTAEELRRRPARQEAQGTAPQTDNDQLNGGLEYMIPPLWKRFVAEQLDFIILVFIKLAITYIIGDYFLILDLDKYDVEFIKKNLQGDSNVLLGMISEILVLEIVFRLVACLFEALCLYGNFGGRPGGATPGKVILGLRVVTAASVSPLEGRARETVLVRPGRGLSFSTSLLRAVLKNSFLALLFPIFTLTIFSQYNRTTYDLLCNVLVVEEATYPPPRNRP